MNWDWDFDVCWTRWAIGFEWGEGYFLFIIGPLTAERWRLDQVSIVREPEREREPHDQEFRMSDD